MTVTSVRMLGWSATGLRCPDYSISFEHNGGTYPISLIQMPNGTGKTTTLTLLRAALSGSAEIQEWDSNVVRSFQKKKLPQETGTFQVSLKYNDKLVTITMDFDFKCGSVKYFTTVGNGKAHGFRPPRECIDFFNPDFINFFVFDGELAQQLLNPKFANAEKAIEYLYKLKYFHDMKNVIKDHWQQVVDSVTASDMKGLNRRKNKVNSLDARILYLKKEKNKIQHEYNKYKEELDELQIKYEEKIKEYDGFGNGYEDKRLNLIETEREVDTQTTQILKDIRSPYYLSSVFGQSILSLKKNMDRAKLPESTAKEFFHDMANEDYCICGRRLDEEHKNVITERASRYLGSEEMALLNSIKSEITDQINESPSKYVTNYKLKIKNYRDAIQERGRAKTELSIVEEAITNGNSELRDAKAKLDELKKRVQQISEKLNKFEDKDKDISEEKSYCIELLEQRLKEAKQKLAEITQTVETKRKTEVLLKIIEQSLTVSQKEIAEYIKVQANSRIKTLLPNNDLRISKIDKALKLEGQDAGSVGENLSVAYAFIATLFNGTDRILPFIVDSPANAIDNKVRTEVAELIPKLADQFIAFTISSERGAFIGPLEKASKGEVQFITMFRRSDEDLETQAKSYKDTVYTNDGVLVTGKEFFWAFHKESEGDE